MRPNEPDVDHPIGIIDPHHDAIFIASDVKHHSAVLEDACAADRAFHIRWRCPIGAPDLPVPGHDRLLCVGIGGTSVEEGFERAERNNPHTPNLP